MSDIRLYVDYKRESGCPVPPYVTVADIHILAIVERAKEMGLIAPYFGVNTAQTPEQSSAVQPAAPADDEATMRALHTAIYGWNGVGCESTTQNAADTLSRIRRGEVPGLTTTAECAVYEQAYHKAITDRDTLKAEVERREKEYLSDVDRMCKNLAQTAKERDAAIARAESGDELVRRGQRYCGRNHQWWIDAEAHLTKDWSKP